jgi:hypothetical protein
MKHVKQITKTQRPAMAQSISLCFAGWISGEHPFCCEFPSLVDCLLCGIGKGSCAED